MAAGQARIAIAPSSTDGIYSDTIVLVVTLQKDLGGGFVAAAGESVAFALTGSFGVAWSASPGGVSPYTLITNATGQCFLGVTATVPGGISASASSTLIVLGLPVTVSTNGLAPNSGPAAQTWQEGRVSLSPLNASNPVTVNQTVTALVERNLGGGGGYVAVAGLSVTITLYNENGAVASPAGPFTGNTDGAGHFTATFTSNTPGRVRVGAVSPLARPIGIPGRSARTGQDEVVGNVTELLYVNPLDADIVFV